MRCEEGTLYSQCEFNVNRQLLCLQLSGKANQGALSHSNAILRRLDLLSEMGGTLALGCCMSCFGAPRMLAALSAFAAAVLPIMLMLVDKVCDLSRPSWHGWRMHRIVLPLIQSLLCCKACNAQCRCRS